jgi:transcriptional regulator with XRE-family HTH domain
MQKEQMDKLRVILGRNLAATRRGLRYTQSQSAELIGCDQNLLSQWETGQRFPSLPYLIRIAVVYDVNINYLFGLCVDVAPDADATYAGAMLCSLKMMSERLNQTLVKSILNQTRRVIPDCETSALVEQVNKFTQVVQNSANLDAGVQTELHTLKMMTQQIQNRQQHRLRLIDRAVQDAIEHDDGKHLGHLALWEGLEGEI